MGFIGDSIRQALHTAGVFMVDDTPVTMPPKEEILEHKGTSTSGRYQHGEGENPHQHCGDIPAQYYRLKKEGLTEKEIATGLGISTTELRKAISVSSNTTRAEKAARAVKLKDNGWSQTAIAREMGVTEGTVRNWLKEGTSERINKNITIANTLQELADKKKYIDIGSGAELELGITQTRLRNAVEMLKEKGYTVENIYVPQANDPTKNTTVQVLLAPGLTKSDAYDNQDKISGIVEYHSMDGGASMQMLAYPKSIDSSRVFIRYGDEGGKDKDGTIELRRGVEDISLGDCTKGGVCSYAQVRIAVDDKYYLKGMAAYSDNIPDGYDIVFNTNKESGTPFGKVLKTMKGVDETGHPNPDNPFGATIKAGGQRWYIDENGERQQSVINKVNEQGDWGTWDKSLSSQMLSKQPKKLVDAQLNLAYANKAEEFESIKNLTNPAVKRIFLESFADDCDAASVHLKAAALPRQASHVLLPIDDLKDNEIYAPQYKNGEHVVLIRYPHSGPFEIPELIVNNNSKQGKAVITPLSKDAVGISMKAAAKMSGADFDGDSALVIPINDKVQVKSAPTLKGLENFETSEYHRPNPDGTYSYKILPEKQKGNEMGRIANLITDMQLQGASPDELTRAVKHSMVVIDAAKHKLDYQQSYKDNQIAELKTRYQTGGASTLISRSTSDVRDVPERKEGAYVTDPKTGKTVKRYWDPVTGEKLYTETGRTYTDYKTGKTKIATEKNPPQRMSLTSDARTLLSGKDHEGTPIERSYANYANKLKKMANEARLELDRTGNVTYNAQAAEKYKAEVQSLKAKLNDSLKNAPRERQAQLVAAAQVRTKLMENPDMTKEERKKVGTQTLAVARARLGASRSARMIKIEDKEWEAIQAGAVHHSVLMSILRNTDQSAVKQRAMPRTSKIAVGSAMQARIKALAASGHTLAEIAEEVNLSTSTIDKYLKG